MTDEPNSLAHPAPEQVASGREGAWLIERRVSTTPNWWSLKHKWTGDASKAIRFSRQVDAEAFIDFHCLQPVARATEHLWQDATPSAQADRGEDLRLAYWTLHRALQAVEAMCPADDPGPAKDELGWVHEGNGDDVAYSCRDEELWKVRQIVVAALFEGRVLADYETPLATPFPGVSPERIVGAGEDNPFTFDFVQALSKATFDQKFGLNAWRDTNDDVRRVWINQTQDVIQTARLEADLSARGGA